MTTGEKENENEDGGGRRMWRWVTAELVPGKKTRGGRKEGRL